MNCCAHNSSATGIQNPSVVDGADRARRHQRRTTLTSTSPRDAMPGSRRSSINATNGPLRKYCDSGKLNADLRR